MTDTPDWEKRYQEGDLPWDTGQPEQHLVDLVNSGSVLIGRVLEIGCGTGTNAIWLAERGFDVLGVDVSPTAIAAARDKAARAGVECEFLAGDFFAESIAAAPFDFVCDRGCFHIFDAADVQRQFAARVAELLAPDGLWFSLIGSTEGPPRDVGPPRRSARDITIAVEPDFEILRLVATAFEADLPDAAQAWNCLMRRRGGPAQPSTVRSRDFVGADSVTAAE